MGGAWDATNVAGGQVRGDHPGQRRPARSTSGETPADIAVEKAGIIKPGATVVMAQQPLEVTEVLLERAAGSAPSWPRGRVRGGAPGCPRSAARCCTCRGSAASTTRCSSLSPTRPRTPRSPWRRWRRSPATRRSTPTWSARRSARSPRNRLEVVRRSPTIVLDAAHNPHGAAAVAEALQDSFTFSPLIGVVGVMADKDYEGVLAAFEPVFAEIVCTQNSTQRSMPAEDLAEVARGIFGVDRVHVARRLDDALDRAATLAEAGGVYGEAIGSGGVLVTGSVITVGEEPAAC